jgi:hypothetical protein
LEFFDKKATLSAILNGTAWLLPHSSLSSSLGSFVLRLWLLIRFLPESQSTLFLFK